MIVVDFIALNIVFLDPVARSGHRMVVDYGNLYCWGGYNPEYWDVENTEDTEYPLFKEVSCHSMLKKLRLANRS